MRRFVLATTAAALVAFVSSVVAQSQEWNGPVTRRAPARTDQIIVKWRTPGAGREAKAAAVAQKAGVKLERKSSIAPRMDVLMLETPVEAAELARLLDAFAAEPDVEFAAADGRRFAHASPADPLLAVQWYLLSSEPSATRAEHAWDVTMGSASTIVAVLDTGVRFEHPDLRAVSDGGKLLPGFDFVSTPAFANDGDGWDADASDPGDWITAQEALSPPFSTSNCLAPGQTHENSSWHGTRVASLIGALTDNAEGLAAAGWNTRILPVRVLGKCGGRDSDILAAMRWAAGVSVPGAPPNPTPAHILNLSLGAEGACSPAYRSVIDELTARGVLVVASVGNEGGPVGAPANCPGVLAVTGLRHAGTKVGFSNLGPEATLGAPGGNCVNVAPGAPCLFSIVAATNSGLTTPAESTYTDQFNYNVGTSFSAPLVAGAAALMHSVNAQLGPRAIIELLRETATPFPTSSTTTSTVCRPPTGPNDVQPEECICTTQTCGAGMLNAHAAVLAAQRPYAVVQGPAVIDVNADVQFDGGASFASNGRSLAAFAWSVHNVEGATPSIASATDALTTLRVNGPSRFTLRLSVADDQGSQDSAELTIATSTPLPSPSPSPPSSGGGGGGGGLPLDALAALLALSALRRMNPALSARRRTEVRSD